MNGPDSKTLATLQAKLALQGWGMLVCDSPEGGSEFIVHRWANTRVLQDTMAVEQFLALLEAQTKVAS